MIAATIRPAFSPITPEDHAGYLWIITILGIIYTTFIAAVRVYVKLRLVGLDDFLLGIATVSVRVAQSNKLYIKKVPTESLVLVQVFHIAESVAVFCGLSKGLGRSQALTSQDDLQATGVVSSPILVHKRLLSLPLLTHKFYHKYSPSSCLKTLPSWRCASRNAPSLRSKPVS